MELLNRKFYGEAAEAFAGKREAEPVLPLTRKQKEELAGLLELLHRAETAPPLEPDPERMAWFRELIPRVKRFADLFVLDVVMSVDERAPVSYTHLPGQFFWILSDQPGSIGRDLLCGQSDYPLPFLRDDDPAHRPSGGAQPGETVY